ncbi:hypothetical protein HYT02_04405 [Candidatus Gottesmanbacteria bacterium]|nr:hypothetical protein [Candidatus Gottesmanbacteria bacterium]
MKFKIILILMLVLILGFVLVTNKKQDSFKGPQQTIERIKNLPEVQEYLKNVPNGKVELSGQDDQNYNIQVFEIKDGHTATFNWYYVNKSTGEIKKEFEF